MVEDNINNTAPQQEGKETKNKRGRPRIYASAEERLRANRERQCTERRRKTEFMNELKKEGRCVQIELIRRLGSEAFNKDFIDKIIKEIDQHEEKDFPNARACESIGA